MNKFLKVRNHDRAIVRVENNATYHITRIRSITLDGNTNTNDVYFVDGLKDNFSNVG